MSEKTKKSKIIIWGRPDVLSWAVEFFLSTRKDWEVINLSSKQGVDGLMHEVENVQPDAVIIYQREYAQSAYLPAQLLVNYPNMAVITINPDNNSMEVFNKKRVCIQEVSDLISVVEGELRPIQ